MVDSRSFVLLLELATQDVENAAKNLGHAIRVANEAKEQLNLLAQYRIDYELRFQNTSQAGLAVTQLFNFRNFIGKLDTAIEGQKLILQDAEYKQEHYRLIWQESEKVRLSYQTLLNRQLKQAEHRDTQREQKQADEFAARKLFYKRNS